MRQPRLIQALLVLLFLCSGARVFPGQDHPLTDAEAEALIARIIAAQHRSDAAIEYYERLERRQVRKNPQNTAPAEDKTFRVVPTGTGIIRAPVEERGRPVRPTAYAKGLRDVEHALNGALHPEIPSQRRAIAKHEKRVRERAELVDALSRAFHMVRAIRETRNGYELVRVELAPNPEFRPFSRSSEVFLHTRATVWVDEPSGSLVRVEAEVFRDWALGGGLLGKVYKGTRFVMEQAEVVPDLWLPSRYEYSIQGRKFLFPFALYEVTTVRNYRRIGPPAEALASVRAELNGLTSGP